MSAATLLPSKVKLNGCAPPGFSSIESGRISSSLPLALNATIWIAGEPVGVLRASAGSAITDMPAKLAGDWPGSDGEEIWIRAKGVYFETSASAFNWTTPLTVNGPAGAGSTNSE